MNLTGRTLGRYQILEQLGRGSMTRVYRAYQADRDRIVVLTVLEDYLRQDPWAQERFRREAEVQGRLQHPAIVRTLDMGQIDGQLYVVKEYVQAGSLMTLLDRAGQRPLPLRQALEITRQVCGALAHAHGLGLIHRDIKPANILIAPAGQVWLTDFGLARLESESPATVSLLGTPDYMPPETIQGKPEDARSDLYAAGVVLYEMATGQIPFKAETPMAVLLKHVNEIPPAPRRLNPGLPENVERILLKGLQKRPDDRYQTAAEMEQAVVNALQTLPVEPISPEELTAGGPPAASLQAQGDANVGGDVVGRDKIIQIVQAPSTTQTLLEEVKQVVGVLANDLGSYSYGSAGRARFPDYSERAQLLAGKLREYAAVSNAIAAFVNTAGWIHSKGSIGGFETRDEVKAIVEELNDHYRQVIEACEAALKSLTRPA